MAKNIMGEMPKDIKNMTLKELEAHEAYRNSPSGKDEFSALVDARDVAQKALETWTSRGYFLTLRKVELLTGEIERG